MQQHNLTAKRAGLVLDFTMVLNAPMSQAHDGDGNDERGRARTCSERDVVGDWGFSLQGSVVGLGPAAGVGVMHLDQYGRITGAETVHLNGEVQKLTFNNGSYRVFPDCTGEAVFIGEPGTGEGYGTVSFAIVQRGAALQLLATTPGRVLSGRAERLHR
ncbi:hypothetical protein [Chitinolyticbacter albus]|uniref:hypothetical protein n=1 Tax=Chitinolyticbacter albus TaxID=2961951 RepID=UPI00210B70C4|nr:hypothetical protein [Chitinolyticbacter albus]